MLLRDTSLMVRALILTLILAQAVAGQENLQVDLYALPPRIHSRLDLAIFTKSESFLATLKKIESASAVEKPVTFTKPIAWGAKGEASELDPLRYFTSFDTDSDKLKGESSEELPVGYKAEWSATREGAGTVDLTFAFTWIPHCRKERIRGGGNDGWLPSYPKLSTQTKFSLKPGEPALAAVWSSRMETEFNPGNETWLYLLVIRQP